ncbi:MAG: adenylosuccinate lyase [bacterium]|nr:adenylosuccinate lyase [bacterium]
MDSLLAISPIDGRYRGRVKELAWSMSELGLFRKRARVIVELPIAFSEHLHLPVRQITLAECSLLRSLPRKLGLRDGKLIKKIETKGTDKHKKTNHDVQAEILFIRDVLETTSLADIIQWIHFAGTSEDVNNIAYALQLRDAVTVLIKDIDKVCSVLRALATGEALVSMLARTHGQPASPTTFGKEVRNFLARMERQLHQLKTFRLLVKYNGATGNYNAHVAAFPDVDWIAFTRDFIERFNERQKVLLFEPNLFTTQIEPHDTYAELFGILNRMSIILIDMCQNLWRYISDDWIVQAIEGTGSSAMPQKVNPIDIENAEGNLFVSHALMEMFSHTLPISRLQRHLSDSTIIRNFGVACGHLLVSYRSILKGLGRYSINDEVIMRALNEHPEVLSEALQNILRREGNVQGHQLIEKQVQGKKVTIQDMRELIDSLPVSAEVKAEMMTITPSNYIGLAGKLAQM